VPFEIGVYPVSIAEIALGGENFIKDEHYFFSFKLRNSQGDSPMSNLLEV
jgi:hypothetical protein